MPAPRLILASQSPRRAQLLREAGFAFEQVSPPFADPDQPDPHHDPAGFVAELALRKAQSLRAALEGDAVILSADTVCVDEDGNLLGKPRDRADAERMLRLLIGGRQRVLTGVAILLPGSEGLRPSDSEGGDAEGRRPSLPEKPAMTPHVVNFADEAVVHCGPVTEAQLQAALDAGGWQDKAGGYNLFDLRAAGWPLSVEGDEATVVGLPMKRVGEELRELAGKKNRKIILEDTPKNRRLLVAWATLGFIPGFVVCSLTHWCMCGHMAHESNHTALGVVNDVVWTTLFAMAAVFCGKSDAHGKSWIRYVSVAAVLLNVIGLPVGFVLLPVPAFFAVWSLRGGAKDWSQEPEEIRRRHHRRTMRGWGVALGLGFAVGLAAWGGYRLYWGIRRAWVPRIQVSTLPFQGHYALRAGDAWAFKLPGGKEFAVWCEKAKTSWEKGPMGDPLVVRYGEYPFQEGWPGDASYIHSRGTTQRGSGSFTHNLEVSGMSVAVQEERMVRIGDALPVDVTVAGSSGAGQSR